MNKIGIFSFAKIFVLVLVLISLSVSVHSAEEELIKLNLNTAKSSDFARVINAIAKIDLCHEITKYRAVNKGFKSVDELLKVPGMNKEIFMKVKHKVLLEI